MNLEIYEYQNQFWSRLLYPEADQPSIPFFELSWAWSWLCVYNPSLLLAEIPNIISSPDELTRLIQNIPATHAMLHEYWRVYFSRPAIERVACELYIKGKIDCFLSRIALNWSQEVTQ